MRQHTERELAVWTAWLDGQWDRPSRTDQYIMQVAHEARYAFRKKRKAFRTKDYALVFKESGKPEKAMTKEQFAAAAKARWLSMMTMPVKVVEGAKTEDG